MKSKTILSLTILLSLAASFLAGYQVGSNRGSQTMVLLGIDTPDAKIQDTRHLDRGFDPYFVPINQIPVRMQ